MSGSRPARPQENCRPNMTDDMWRLVQDAWNQDPSIRPTMIQLEELEPSILYDVWAPGLHDVRRGAAHRFAVAASVPIVHPRSPEGHKRSSWNSTNLV
jgi:hypothetical protein